MEGNVMTTVGQSLYFHSLRVLLPQAEGPLLINPIAVPAEDQCHIERRLLEDRL